MENLRKGDSMNAALNPKLVENGKGTIFGRVYSSKRSAAGIELPLKSPFETSFGVTSRKRVLIVRAFDKSGASGYGECTAMEEPFYSHETIDTARTIISKYIAPMLASAGISNAGGVARTLSPIQGNCMAVGAVETAIWDLEAKLADRPLWQHIGGTKNSSAAGCRSACKAHRRP